MNGMRSWPSTLLTISFDGAVDELGPGIQQLVPDWSMSQRVDVADVETHLGPRLGGARPARAVRAAPGPRQRVPRRISPPRTVCAHG